MNVLIIGSGGREHAIAWKISQSPLLSNLFIAPGNGGTENVATNLDISVTNFEAIAEAVKAHNIELLVVGPEDPLVKGIRDFFEGNSEFKDLKIIGPGALGATFEGSKEFSKKFMFKQGIPTAKYLSVSNKNLEEGLGFLEGLKAPYVLKADGLAAGKGVLILDSLEEAKKELKQMLDGKFGDASTTVVIEEFLDGIELSVFILTDGKNYKILPEAKDYKRIGEGDEGLNTGGMGAVSPVPFANDSFMKKVEDQVIIPTVKGFEKENIPYNGFLFIGLMNVNGNPFVVEYNVRMGDPETEVVMPRIKSDLLAALDATATGKLNEVEFEVDEQTACTVMLVSGGYPESYEKGKTIEGAETPTPGIIFHAGTSKNDKGELVTSGGRVLAVSSLASDLNQALAKSYQAITQIKFEKMNFRKDIGLDLL